MARRKNLQIKEKAEKIFRSHGGILRTHEAIHLGIHPRTLYSMRDEGILEELQRGLYCFPGLPGNTQPDLVAVAAKIPKGVFCLISALFFHKFTTQIPHMIYVALPEGTKAPQITHPPVTFCWMRKLIFDVGIETHCINGVSIRCYSKEKTIVDCFKHRNKIGIDVAIEALKKYWHSSTPRLELLLKYAKICRVEKVIQPYVEAIINASS